MPMRSPVHPGIIIRDAVIEPLGLTVTEAAAALGVARPTLSKLLNGRASLSAEMALRVEKAFGPAMDHLLRMQLAYDTAEVRKREAEIQVKRHKAAREPRSDSQ